MNEKIIRKEEIAIKPFHKLCVGDNLYFQQLEELDNNDKYRKSLLNLIVDTTIQSVDRAMLIISEVEVEYNPAFHTSIINVKIVQASDEEMLDVYKDGKYYENTIKEHKSLACDTASFNLKAGNGQNLKDCTIKTFADGYYGNFFKYKKGYGMLLDFDVTTDAYDFDDMKSILSTIFEAA